MRWPWTIGLVLLAMGCGQEPEEKVVVGGVVPMARVSSGRSAQPFSVQVGVSGPGTSAVEGAPPNVIRYPMPFMAREDAVAADESASLRYQAENGASAEVEAVCDVKDGLEVTCWHPDGSPYPEFAKRVKSRYKGPRPSDYLIPRNPNVKNRLVMARIGVPGWNSIQLKSVGSRRNTPSVSLEVPRPRLEGEPIVFLTGGFALEPRNATQTSMRFTISLPLLETPVMECKVGEKTRFGGDTFTIVDIHQGKPRGDAPHNFGGESADKWYVVFERTNNADRDKMLLIAPIDAEGHRIGFLDERDVAMAQESIGKNTRGPHRYRPAEYNIILQSYNRFSLVLNFDPRKTGRLRFEGFTSKLVDLTGIPLDPKK